MMTRHTVCAFALVVASMAAGMGPLQAAEEEEAKSAEVTYNVSGMT